MVFAMNSMSQRNLSMQFQNRSVKKEYTALLDGVLGESSGEIELPFRLDVNNRPRQIYDPVNVV